MNRTGTVLLSSCLLAACGVLACGVSACGGIAGGDRDATIASCQALCAVQADAPGCAPSPDACDARCAADGMFFTEDCLVAAKTYYDCAARLTYTCPGAPDGAETGDTTCAAARSAYLGCKITGQ
jgi:hypothetical protein